VVDDRNLEQVPILVNPPFHLVFCGTPGFAVPALEALAQAGFSVDLVVTRPDKPKGRGMEMAVSPVKQAALSLELPIAQPDTIKNNGDFRTQLQSLRPEAIVVVGYGRIIPPWMIDLPPLGNINLHSSVLPKYRGAAPIQWAVACGETVTGVTTMRIDAGLDTGDILLQREVPIAVDDTAETLSPKLAAVGAELMVGTLLGLRERTVVPQVQDHSRASLAPILRKEDGRIDFSRSAAEIHNRLRGFQPWPGAYTSFRGRQLVICGARVVVSTGLPSPGSLLVEDNRLLAGCHDSFLELVEVQPEGKKRMAARDFINGYRPRSGEKLGVA
jgi:methionyl-tRNA formyltransferase